MVGVYSPEYCPRLRKLLYGADRKKHITYGFLNLLKTDLALLLWYLDDGSIYYHKKNDKINGREICLSTEEFSKEENEMIALWFSRNYDVQWGVNKERNYWRLVCGAINATKFFSMLKFPNVPESMKYKFDFRYQEALSSSKELMI